MAPHRDAATGFLLAERRGKGCFQSALLSNLNGGKPEVRVFGIHSLFGGWKKDIPRWCRRTKRKIPCSPGNTHSVGQPDLNVIRSLTKFNLHTLCADVGL